MEEINWEERSSQVSTINIFLNSKFSIIKINNFIIPDDSVLFFDFVLKIFQT